MKKLSANKIPQITFFFWAMKICATTLGETAGDLLSMTLGLGYAISFFILFAFLIVALAFQLLSRRNHPFLFWFVVLLTSTAGTAFSDYMDRTLALGYPLGSAILLFTLAGIILVWKRTEGTISIHQINTKRSECFFWLTILVSNTLGTALGDFLADSSGLGFAGGALLIGVLIAVITALYYSTALSRTLLFWSAFVLTRPFGATIGDVLTKSPEQGGAGLGTIGSSAILLTILIGLIIWSNKKRN